MERTPSSIAKLSLELREWAEEAKLSRDARRKQHPVDELVAEHQLIRLVLNAMRAEAGRFSRDKELRLEFWEDAVDFVGNFGLLRHYRKKANHLFPLLAKHGLAKALEGLDAEQSKDIELALELCDAIGDGDREAVTRLVALYADVKKRKMEHEEQQLLQPGKAALPAEALPDLRAHFDFVDWTIPPDQSRADYFAMVRRLVSLSGLPDPFQAP
jgi:hemerythrin-like domain-containing protein